MTIAPIHTTEMHTGGEPVRIIESGYPPLQGLTLLERRRFARENLDHLRHFLMYEPRGHFDMYGALLVEPDHPEADLAVLFMHNEGYSTMCGHAVIALGRYAVDRGLVDAHEPITQVNIQCPCGLVKVYVAVSQGKSADVHFESVPAFVLARQKLVTVKDIGPVHVDIAYGGAFYAFVAADQFGLEIQGSPVRALVDVASLISAAVKDQVEISHPDDKDLGYLYGTILTDGKDAQATEATANICVFADRQVDRSPTGSGVTARIALQYRNGQVRLQQRRIFKSVTGAEFTAQALSESTCGPHKAVIVEVAGKAHYTGTCLFSHEPDDRIGQGFLLD